MEVWAEVMALPRAATSSSTKGPQAEAGASPDLGGPRALLTCRGSSLTPAAGPPTLTLARGASSSCGPPAQAARQPDPARGRVAAPGASSLAALPPPVSYLVGREKDGGRQPGRNV